MNPSQTLKLVFATLLLANALSKGLHKRRIIENAKPELLGQSRTWRPLNIDPFEITGVGKVIHFSSLNSELVYTAHDSGDGKNPITMACYMWALKDNRFYASDSFAFGREYCANSSVTKINSQGSLLFLNGDQGYFYVQNDGNYSYLGLRIDGDFSNVVSQGVEVALTKSGESGKDYFRLFSRASDVNGNYPENFYALVANTTNGNFANGGYNTLTLKKLDWNFKQTSKDVRFTKIDQVNFISTQNQDWILEGQWITGKGTTTTTEDLSQTASKPACQYGGVNTRSFLKGPVGNQTMYGRDGSLHFPCSTSPGQRTYQGIVSYNTTNKYFYAINPDTGKIQVCWGIPSNFEFTTSLADLTSNCASATKPALKLQTNEYYSDAGVLAAGRSNLTVVNIKNKANNYALRQVVINFSGASNLPTFDTETYFYSVYDAVIFRMKKVFKKGQVLEADYYTVTSLKEKNEPVNEQEQTNMSPASDFDRNQRENRREEKVAVIF